MTYNWLIATICNLFSVIDDNCVIRYAVIIILIKKNLIRYDMSKLKTFTISIILDVIY